jgi:IS5 family transposase
MATPQGDPWLKAHVGADADTALVEKVAVTPGNAHDGRNGEAALPDDPGDVFADSAYRGAVFREAVRARGGNPRVVITGVWAQTQDEADRRLAAWNGPIHQIRCRIEKIFGTWKRSYGFRRMRWRGLAKAHLQARLTAIAYNLWTPSAARYPAAVGRIECVNLSGLLTELRRSWP